MIGQIESLGRVLAGAPPRHFELRQYASHGSRWVIRARGNCWTSYQVHPLRRGLIERAAGDLALRVDCPECGAPAGHRCVFCWEGQFPGRPRHRAHAKRWAAARAAQTRAARRGAPLLPEVGAPSDDVLELIREGHVRAAALSGVSC